MQNRFGPFNPSDRERLERERYESLMNFLGLGAQTPTGVPDPRRLASPATAKNAAYLSGGLLGNENQRVSALPFHQDNRNKDGTWAAPLADRGNVLGTSVDPREPIWPKWRQTPPPHHEGDFISDDPFFDIDEISGKVEFYPPGRPLRDGNVDGNPARRQRVDDLPAGNSWRRRLFVGRGETVTDSRSNITLAAERPTVPPRPEPPFNPFTGAPKTVCLPSYRLPDGTIEPEFCFTYGEWTSNEPFVYVDPQTGERRYYNPGAGLFPRGEDRNRNKIPDQLETPEGPYLVRPGPTS